MPLLCFYYQKHSGLVQHNHVQFYDTSSLPGVELGNKCARKYLKEPTLKFVISISGVLRPFLWHP